MVRRLGSLLGTSPPSYPRRPDQGRGPLAGTTQIHRIRKGVCKQSVYTQRRWRKQPNKPRHRGTERRTSADCSFVIRTDKRKQNIFCTCKNISKQSQLIGTQTADSRISNGVDYRNKTDRRIKHFDQTEYCHSERAAGKPPQTDRNSCRKRSVRDKTVWQRGLIQRTVRIKQLQRIQHIRPIKLQGQRTGVYIKIVDKLQQRKFQRRQPQRRKLQRRS